MTLNDLDKNDHFVALFLGKQGTGKDVAVASLAKKYIEAKKKLLIWDIDQRARGILGAADFLDKSILDNIEVDQDFDVGKGYAGLEKKLELLLAYQNSGQVRYGGLVIDSASTMQKMLLFDSIRLKGQQDSSKGRIRGTVKFTSPDDYLYASMAFQQFMYNGFKLLKMDVVMSGWIVDRWGKDKSEKNEYAANVVLGSKMLATEKLAEEIPGCFDEVYVFGKEDTGISSRPLKYYVEFESDVAKTARPKLKNKGQVDLTNKNFIDVYTSLINGTYKG